MGYIPEHVLDDWLRQQHSSYKQRERRVVVKLPCCGTGIEVTAGQEGEDQFITCPNKHCGKRHLLTFGMNPKLSSELEGGML